MPASPSSDASNTPQDPGLIVRLGGWLFRQRSWLPLPLVFALVLVPPDPSVPRTVRWLGAAVTAGGELLRLWGVRHIGVISRTRSDRLGPLIDTGPFAYVRNPLYIGNISLWIGFSLTAALPWVAVAILLLLAAEYHAVVRWEEYLLEARRGASYRDYVARIPRWLPRLRRAAAAPPGGGGFSWADTIFSERGTLIAIAVGYVLLFMKERV
jgi:protein-S-isoprenylcysteine O-methyltransferase Ste14